MCLPWHCQGVVNLDLSAGVVCHPDLCGRVLAPTAGLNIEGKMVDSCLANGTACGQAAADAYCQYIGFDGAVDGLFTTMLSDEPNRAVSGVLLWRWLCAMLLCMQRCSLRCSA